MDFVQLLGATLVGFCVMILVFYWTDLARKRRARQKDAWMRKIRANQNRK